MPKLAATPEDAAAVNRELTAQGLDHLRARKHGSLVILESGPAEDPIPHARLRRATVHLWTLEIATHTGCWERTDFRDLRNRLVELLMNSLPWVLAPRE